MQRGPQVERTVFRAIVLANPHAHRQLPESLFRGPFDEWWQQRADRMACTFRGARLQKLWEAFPRTRSRACPLSTEAGGQARFQLRLSRYCLRTPCVVVSGRCSLSEGRCPKLLITCRV
jgi:hypothetical protein